MLTAELAITRACETTGLNDFGDDPQGLKEGLQRTLEGVAKVPLTPRSWEGFEAKIVSDLSIRLRVEEYCKQNPEVLEQEIRGPVLITGIPRTGTTITMALLALDPQFRFLRQWEALSPLPPPRLDEEPNDPRAVAARKRAANVDKSLHISDPDGPEEDLFPTAGYDMKAYLGQFPMPQDFLDWWVGLDFNGFYAFHRKLLKILQSQRPPNFWVLKAPPHLFKLDAFTAQYPDSKVILTHRDPARIIPSDASLRYNTALGTCEHEKLNKKDFGPSLLNWWSRGMDKALRDRAMIGEDRFADVRNIDVVSDPVGTFKALYDRLGLTFDDAQRNAIEVFLETNYKGAHGSHEYTAEEYGLTEQEIREEFSDYCERFDL